ncbi:S-ribosylhomocysteine lyase [Miniphocaeibacter massiliensis]|uniref:S-ribosylhomocysteine lyase n=1 Tax=Miniphocaeibacter massiliensis TaxID=2041841 RepID=UPI000C07C127|nr:S-ribosylhomocysteine lyase [Miniphocaeibacter massiliensis]
MEKIDSFKVNHLNLLPGVYVSRKDFLKNDCITTFDIRITEPNKEPVLNTAEIHTIEHLAATYLRNNEEYKNKIIYFGPMGCRTGFYLLLNGNLDSNSVIGLLKDLFEFISNYEGDIPGASAKDCGNYLDMNLPMAKYVSKKFLNKTLYNLQEENLAYPI